VKTAAFPLIKVSATGNDFLLIDLLTAPNRQKWEEDFGKIKRADLVKKWCDRHEGLGADGLVFLESDTSLAFAWDFYNSDGGSAEMCGNAARAVSLYFFNAHKKSDLIFRSKVGEVHAIVRSADDIEVTLPKIAESDWNQLINWQGSGSDSQLHFDFVRAGVPHAVIKVPTLQDRDSLKALAFTVKAEARFQKEGVNVTFVHALAQSQVESVTYERGVEGFTRACGTGAIAAAYSLLQGEENREIEVRVPGGTLFVIWKSERPHLRGPAQMIAEMHVFKENP
jgi:diaminopimelate epimerase